MPKRYYVDTPAGREARRSDWILPVADDPEHRGLILIEIGAVEWKGKWFAPTYPDPENRDSVTINRITFDTHDTPRQAVLAVAAAFERQAEEHERLKIQAVHLAQRLRGDAEKYKD